LTCLRRFAPIKLLLWVSAEHSKTETFDVFLCHNSEDKPAVREIAQQLVKEGIKPWLDEEQIRPGTSWQTALGQQIETIKSAVVFVGQRGIGPWQNQEIQALLSQFVKPSVSCYSSDLIFCRNNPSVTLDAGEPPLRRFPGQKLGPDQAAYLGHYWGKTSN
jgi:hypothetical protein